MSNPASGQPKSSSSRKRRHAQASSSKETMFSHVFSVLPLVAFCAFSIFCAAPWYFASTPWVAQYWLVAAGIGMVLILLVEITRRHWTPLVGPALAIPVISLALIFAAGYAYVQSLPLFEGSTTSSSFVPASIKLQRWFLGAEDSYLDKRFELMSASVSDQDKDPKDLKDSDGNATTTGIDRHPFRLAISIEPLHTKAAIGSLVLAAVMVWVGSVCFTSPRWQISLLIVIALMGVVMGMLGLAHVLSWQKVNWLGLSPASSFATFVSRNSAGGFLNVCLSAALGLASWTFIKPRNPNEYFDVRATNPIIESFRKFEAGFARLNTPQIASVLAVAFLLACVACTTSRGATIGGVVACVIVLMLSGKRGHNSGRVLFAIIVVTLGLTLILFFEFDERISKRFEELFRIEAELKDGRSYIWGIAMKAFTYFISTGSGLGTFHYAYLPFQLPKSEGWYYHAESLVAQTMVEFGWLGVCLIAAIVIAMFRIIGELAKPVEFILSTGKAIVPNPQYAPAYVTSLALLVSLGIHCLVDFPLVVPAVFVPAGLLVGMANGVARAKRAWPQTLHHQNANHQEWIAQNAKTSEEYSHERSNPLDSESQYPQTAMEGSVRRRHESRSDVAGSGSGLRSRRRNGRTKQLEEIDSIAEQQLTWERFAFIGNSRETLLFSTGFAFLSIFLMASSLSSMDALQRCDDMAAWVKSHEKLPREKRIASPSSYLVGMWAGSSIPITQASPALRVIGDSVLYEFRSERFDALEAEAASLRKISWEETSPILINALLNRLIDVDGDAKVKKTTSELAGGDKQLARWDKAFELISTGRQTCPLDWRLAWGEVLLDRKLSRSHRFRYLELAALLSRHRADSSFQIGVLAREMGNAEIAMKQWKQTLGLSAAFATRIATIIAIDTPDDQVPVDLFSDKIDVLRSIATSPFTRERFPKSNSRIWEKMEVSARSLPKNEPLYWLSLSEIAQQKGDIETELECLREASAKQPMNRDIRMRWAGRLAANNDIDEAIEQAEFCKTLAPDDPQVLAFLKRWLAVRDEKR